MRADTPLIRSHRQAAQLCPNCSYAIDIATSVHGKRPPKQGDFSICLNCAQVLRYNKDLSLYRSSLSDLDSESIGPIEKIAARALVRRILIRGRLH